jgi:NAD(P)-dependent dehydrogenase (short-subunit alcohol dehydrogenase family)
MNTMNLTFQTVFITGGATGIGFALARAFADLGNRVIICATVQGRTEVLLESDGPITFPLDKKAIVSRKGDTTLIEEVPDGVAAQVLSPEGHNEMEAKGIAGVATVIASKDGNVVKIHGGGMKFEA